MNCPVCKNVNLVMSERQGIEIDYCPQCRGVWLDRGELDKLIEKAAGPAPAGAQSYDDTDRGRLSSHGGYRESYPGKPYKKKKGLLGELFDFD
jgi:uncharacterized protein